MSDIYGDYPLPTGGTTRFNEFKFWCTKVIPLVYDDSLSTYELLSKMVFYINNLMENDRELITFCNWLNLKIDTAKGEIITDEDGKIESLRQQLLTVQSELNSRIDLLTSTAHQENVELRAEMLHDIEEMQSSITTAFETADDVLRAEQIAAYNTLNEKIDSVKVDILLQLHEDMDHLQDQFDLLRVEVSLLRDELTDYRADTDARLTQDETEIARRLTQVIHDNTLTGSGTIQSPLQVVAGADGGLITVATDDSLNGNGTNLEPLSINVHHDITLVGNGTSNNPLKVMTDLTTHVEHDESLEGYGNVDEPLKVHRYDYKLETVSHDGTLSGAGTQASPLSVVAGADGNLVAVAHDTSLTGTGQQIAPIALNVQHDNSLSGAGSQASSLSLNINHDGTLLGTGAANSPLSVATTGITNVSHDSSLSGNGTQQNPLSINVHHNASLSGTGIESDPLIVTDRPVLHDSSITGDGYGTSPLALNVQHDASMSGVGVNSNPLRTNLIHDGSLIGTGSELAPIELNVKHDTSLNGVGNDDSPLSVSIAHDGTLSGDGSQASPLSVIAGSDGGLMSVSHDNSLSGAGTVQSPLSISVNHDASLVGAGSQTQAMSISVQHDGTLSGTGSVGNPLSVVNPGLADVQHDGSLQGNGTLENPLELNIQHGTSLTGLGNSDTPIEIAVIHDVTLTGNGTQLSPLSVVGGGSGGQGLSINVSYFYYQGNTTNELVTELKSQKYGHVFWGEHPVTFGYLDLPNTTRFQNVIFDGVGFTHSQNAQTTFHNCSFYNCSYLSPLTDVTSSMLEFVDCTFIGSNFFHTRDSVHMLDYFRFAGRIHATDSTLAIGSMEPLSVYSTFNRTRIGITSETLINIDGADIIPIYNKDSTEVKSLLVNSTLRNCSIDGFNTVTVVGNIIDSDVLHGDLYLPEQSGEDFVLSGSAIHATLHVNGRNVKISDCEIYEIESVQLDQPYLDGTKFIGCVMHDMSYYGGESYENCDILTAGKTPYGRGKLLKGCYTSASYDAESQIQIPSGSQLIDCDFSYRINISETANNFLTVISGGKFTDIRSITELQLSDTIIDTIYIGNDFTASNTTFLNGIATDHTGGKGSSLIGCYALEQIRFTGSNLGVEGGNYSSILVTAGNLVMRNAACYGLASGGSTVVIESSYIQGDIVNTAETPIPFSYVTISDSFITGGVSGEDGLVSNSVVASVTGGVSIRNSSVETVLYDSYITVINSAGNTIIPVAGDNDGLSADIYGSNFSDCCGCNAHNCSFDTYFVNESNTLLENCKIGVFLGYTTNTGYRCTINGCSIGALNITSLISEGGGNSYTMNNSTINTINCGGEEEAAINLVNTSVTGASDVITLKATTINVTGGSVNGTFICDGLYFNFFNPVNPQITTYATDFHANNSNFSIRFMNDSMGDVVLVHSDVTILSNTDAINYFISLRSDNSTISYSANTSAKLFVHQVYLTNSNFFSGGTPDIVFGSETNAGEGLIRLYNSHVMSQYKQSTGLMSLHFGEQGKYMQQASVIMNSDVSHATLFFSYNGSLTSDYAPSICNSILGDVGGEILNVNMYNNSTIIVIPPHN